MDAMKGQMLELQGKTYIVTGAGSGIGRAVAIRLASAGAQLVLVGRRRTALEETASYLEVPIALVAGDVAEDIVAAQAVTAAEGLRGAFRGAFNGAGTFGEFSMLHEDTALNFDNVMSVNLRGVWTSMRHQIAALSLRGQGGSIVNCGSVAAHRGHVRSPIYSATKHAIVGLTKSTALQYGAQGIRANVVSPGSTDTPMLRDLYTSQDDLIARSRRSALNRFGKADEIAEAVYWLLSDASSYVTGQSLVVDGGVTAAAP